MLFVNRCGSMVLTFLVLYLTESKGYGETQAGLVLTAFGVGGMGGVLAGGWLVDRVGFRVVQVACQALGGIGYLLFPLLEGRWSLLAGAAAIGFVSEGFRPANGAAITTFSRPSTRLRAFGLNRLALNLGLSIAPLIGGWLAGIDYDWLFWINGGTCLLAALGMALLLPSGAPHREHAREKGPPPWRDRIFRWGWLLLLAQGLIFFQITSTYPLHLGREYGFSTLFIGRAMAVNTLLIVAVEMPLIHYLSRFNPLGVMGLAGIFIGLGFGLLPLSSSATWVLSLVVVWTIGEMLMMPMAMSWVASRTVPANRGAYMAAMGIGFSISVSLAPLAGTALFEHLGPNSVWYACLGMGVLVAAGFTALAHSVQSEVSRKPSSSTAP